MANVDYRLDPSTLRAVRQAGESEAALMLQKASFAQNIGDIITNAGEQIMEDKLEKEGLIEQWDSGFDAMGDRGSWASGELYDQFQVMEAAYRDEYLQAVRIGDKQAQRRMLKDQAARAAGLKGWKETMETAKQVNDGVGWSVAFKNDPDSLHIVNALTKLDGTNARVKFGEQGEMVFDITMQDGRTRTVTRREIDDMISKGVKPVKLELDFMNNLLDHQKDGFAGNLFDFDINRRSNLLNMSDEEIPALMREDFGGGGSFAEHIKTHPDMIAEFADVLGNRDGIISDEERAGLDLLIQNDVNKIVDAMEANPVIAKKYLAEWKTLQQQSAWQKGADHKAAQDEERLNTSLKQQQQQRQYTLTTAEQNQAAYDRRVENIKELRKEPIILDGVNLGLAKDFKQDSEGNWYITKSIPELDAYLLPGVNILYLDQIDFRGTSFGSDDVAQALNERQLPTKAGTVFNVDSYK